MHIPKPLPVFGKTTPDDVLEQLANGKQQKTIAYELGVRPEWLNKQLRREQIRRGARNITELIALYVERKSRR